MNNITLRELFKEIDKELLNITVDNASYRSGVLCDARREAMNLLESRIEGEVRVYKDYTIPDSASQHVVTATFSNGYVLRMPIIIKIKLIKRGGYRSCSEYGLNTCRIDWTEADKYQLDMTIDELIERYSNAVNERNNNTVARFEQEMKEFPAFIANLIQDMKSGEEIDFSRIYRLENFEKEYKKYREIKFEK